MIASVLNLEVPKSRRGRFINLVLLTVLLPGVLPAAASSATGNAPSMGGVFGTPLNVGPGEHAVVMQYEAWFGPGALPFYPGNEANPILQTADMVGVNGCSSGCGYNSENPSVILQHTIWLQYMGVDAITLDDTNDVACIYNTDAFAAHYQIPSAGSETLNASSNCSHWKPYWQHIGSNNANIYSAWNGLKTPLKIIPLLGASDPVSFTPDPYDSYQPHKSALEKEIIFYGNLMQSYPGMSVLYGGKPLMLLFVAVNANQAFPLIVAFLQAHPALTAQYTFRVVSGYLDSQPQFWAPAAQQTFWANKSPSTPTASGPTKINPRYGFWSQVDRFNTTCTSPECVNRACDGSGCWTGYPFYPTYSMDPTGKYVENFTAAVATAGAENTGGGWGWPATATAPAQYFEDASLRWSSNGAYSTFEKFMCEAQVLKPAFLFILQFNEFKKPDQGFDARTSNDLEPANALLSDREANDSWGYTGISAVHDAIVRYRNGSPCLQ